MKLYFVGTGHGMALNCYNSCFVIQNEKNEYMLVDSGGGNTLLKNLKLLNVDSNDIYHVFITHTHIDHILGIIWFIRDIAKSYLHNLKKNETYIYGNDEVINAIHNICTTILPKDFISLLDKKIKLVVVQDGDKLKILDYEFNFFDIRALKVKQYGFYILSKNNKLTFIGDEYCKKEIEKYVLDSQWLIADAFMCGEKAEEYNPMEKHMHSSVKYISQIANRNNIKNLILIHMIDDDLENRKRLFKNDARKYFKGNVYVPDDLEMIELKEF